MLLLQDDEFRRRVIVLNLNTRLLCRCRTEPRWLSLGCVCSNPPAHGAAPAEMATSVESAHTTGRKSAPPIRMDLIPRGERRLRRTTEQKQTTAAHSITPGASPTHFAQPHGIVPKAQRRDARRLFEGLQVEGYRCAYDVRPRPDIRLRAIGMCARRGLSIRLEPRTRRTRGVMQTLEVPRFRLTFSRQMFVVAYPRETQEMVFDAHNRAFAFFGGVPRRMVYNNLKAVVEPTFTSKERLFNRRFVVLANHYLLEPVACTPASGREEDQVEKHVGNIRE